ncbi:polymorphic toxin-type HINT domain-containing protein [Streptomyces sp. NBC_00829]|uniref:polymorphic toxin-type HINT domain-containing protein n=2 Tax=unclassified Streptomyces TaxID=2593676 RepID=UPI0038630B37|nr:polymorphic toxin-type HINT domain-containing protein [Streptomyces sp. NBC_00829]
MPLRGRLVSRRIPRRTLAATVLGLSLALSASSVQAVAFADEEGRGRPGVQDFGDPVEGTNGKVKQRPADAARKAAVQRLDKATWPKQGSAQVPVSAAASKSPAEVKAGGLPVSVTATKSVSKAKAAPKDAVPAPDKVKVDVLAPERAAKLGAGALLRVRRADDADKAAKVRLNVDYSTIAEGFGGNYGARLRLVQLPACAAVAEPGSKACPESPKPLATVNNVKDGTLSADVMAAPAQSGISTMDVQGESLVALEAGPSSAQGTYKATALSPSASWNVAPSSGGFSWNYPLRTVPTPGGQTPTIGLGYSSQSADGRTSATNNQGSWIGEGFSYDPGYIERRYKPCSDDGHSGSGEQCWAFDNATILLNGSATELVKDDETGQWRLASDDGAKVDKLTNATNGDNDGEHWRVTTTDGTEYYFGLNRLPGWGTGDEETGSAWTAPVFGDDPGEPCYNATFTSAHCKQAWRWNLDYVKDTHGNVMSYFYAPETNHYALNGKTDVNGTAYHRGGYLKRVDYGQRDGQVYAAKAPARVSFTTAERCLPSANFDCAESKRTKANAAYWPDVPVDQECKADTKCKVGQTFWTTKRLTGVTTQMRKDATTYQDVDAWTFTHLFTDNGDDSKTLWLSKIDHEGRAGSAVRLPSLELYGQQLVNRVDAIGDNLAPFHRFRLASVLSETGAQLDVNYAPTNCTKGTLPKPGESTKRCYPVKWAPPGHIEPITDWFHKYVVAEIIETDRTGGGESLVTRYDYQGNAAWRKAEPDGITEDKYLTWGGWQGYGKVKVTSGSADQQITRIDYTYMQGMDGDKDPDGGMRSVKAQDSTGTEYTDSKEFTGFELEAATYDGAELLSKVISTPWKYNTSTQTKSWGTKHATIVKPETTRGFTPLAAGGWRETKSTTKYETANHTGRVYEAEDLGDVSTPSDDTCTRTWYADRADKNILSLPSRSESVAVKCAATPNRKTQVIADERTSYDGGAFGSAPSTGNATKTERLTSHDGTTGTYQVTGTTVYDAFGRPTLQKDGAQVETKTAYTDVNGLISKTTLTNALGHVTTTDYAPAWGQSAGQTDPNGKRTDLAYDGLGRLTSVWLPDRAKTQTPSIKYSYNVRRDKVVAIKTEKIEIDGSYGSEYQLYDGLLRPRQIQTEGLGGTRMVADSFYDGTGKVKKTNATYNAAGVPSDELLIVPNGEVLGQNLFKYDGLGRKTADIFAVSGVEQWRSTTTYNGERVEVDPPIGGVPTTTVSDAGGHITEMWHHHGTSPSPSAGHDTTKYTYTPSGKLETVTDAKNNVWRYEYDQLGRKTKTIDPDAGPSTTTYDALDRPVKATDSRNKTVSTVYDELGRPVTTWEGDPTTGTKLTETRYDKAGWLGQAWASLRYISGTEYFASVTQSLDNFYRPLKTAYTVPASQGAALAGTYVFSTAYNRDGTVQSAGLPAAGGLPAEVLVPTYDELQRPTKLTGTTPYVTNTVYSNTSHLQQLELSTGTGKKVWQTFAYETGTDRLTRSVLDIAGGAAPVKESNYSYDQVGNVMSISDTANAGAPDVQCFAYDYAQRLAEAWTPASTATDAAGSGTVGTTAPVEGTKPKACAEAPGANPLGGPAPYWKSYVTDAIGNRTSETVHDVGLNSSKNVVRTFTYGGAGTAGKGPHQLTKLVENMPTGDRQTTYTYDATGNRTTRTIAGDTQSLEWDTTGKLKKATEADGKESSYLYAADGSRVQRKDSTGTTIYLPGMELRLPVGGSTAEGTRYYSHAGQTVAVRTKDGKLSFIAADHHGTGELAIDSVTGGVSQRRFDPYGVERGEATGKWPGEKGFVGGTTDASTRLTHLGAREYDSAIGKFISVDPVIDYTAPEQMNAYSYAHNSPVTLSDPDGLDPCGGLKCGHPGDNCADIHIYCLNPLPDAATDTATKEVAKAKEQQSQAGQVIKQAAKALVKIARDLLGIDAALDCFSSGDLGSCGETALNIAGSFAGGLAGKILAKYGAPWKWVEGARLAKRVANLVGDLIGGVMDMIKTSGAVKKAEKALAAARAKAQAALAKGKALLKKDPQCHSFLPGTAVLLSDGTTKPIEEVALGDKVTVTDPETGEAVTREVVGTIVTEDDKHFVDLTIADEGGEAALIATTTHPFWVENEHRFVKAGDLKPGMLLRTPEGKTSPIESLRFFDKRQRTHDLTINGIHTYYVLAGATPVLVHNCNLGDYADSVRNEPGVKFASEYTSPSGAKYYGRNKHGQQAEGPLADALERTGHHGGCAEVHCLIQAQAAEGPEAIRGGTMQTVRTRNNSMPTSNTDGHGEPAHPCGRCGRLLEDLEIN